MSRVADSVSPAASPPPAHCAIGDDARQLARLVEDADVDAAIESGLMAFAPCAACARDAGVAAAMRIVGAAQERLRTAWAARERYRARQARQRGRERARAERRASASAPAAATAATVAESGPRARPPLPAAAAAALARAKARAADR